MLLLLAAAGLTALHEPAQPRPLPPAPAVALLAEDRAALETLRSAGVTVSAGWDPLGVLDDPRGQVTDPWAIAAGRDGVRAWDGLLPGLRLLYDAQGRLLVEDAVVVLDPAHCYHVARTVRRIGVGLPPPAGPAIAAQLEAWLEPPYFSSVPSPVGRGTCTGPDRSQWGFAIEQAEPLDCTVPGRDVICFTLAKWRHDFGARDVWTSTHRTFDVMTGERLDDDALHPRLDVTALDALLDASVCASGGRCDGVAAREGRIHPTATALVIELSPGEAADPVHGSLRVRVPRSALPLLP